MLLLPFVFLLQTASAQFTVNLMVTEPHCFGLPSGSITASTSGGTAPFTYQWSTGASGATLSNIFAGSYSVTVTDGTGATVTESTTAGQPTVLSVNLTANTCQVPFVITATGSGGNLPYSYTWSTGATGSTITVATAGTYCVTMTDQNLCGSVDCITVDFNPLDVSVTTNGLACPDSDDGAVQAVVTGGSPPYTYQWSNGATTASQNGLAAGSYTVTVTDAGGCSDSATGTVSAPPPLMSSVTGTGPGCAGGTDGTATVSASGGTPPYSFLWSTGATSATIDGLSTGTYTVTITDGNGCDITDMITLGPVSGLTASASATPQSCPGVDDGTATAMANSGVPPYIYLWSNGSTTQTIGGLAPGAYTVTIIDGNGCTATATATIDAAPILDISLSSTSVSTCGADDGTATVTIGQGMPLFTIAWSTGASTATISGLSGGTYSVTVTDGNGCTANGSVLVIEPPAVSVAVVATDTVCPGEATGMATAMVSGGTTPFVFSWNTGETTATINDLPAGTYTVTVTDASGCQDSGSATIVESPPLQAVVSGTETVCGLGNTGEATVTAIGGTPPYTYLWNTGESTESIEDLLEGTYTVDITDANGCTTTAEITIDIIDDFEVNVVGRDVLCNGGSTGSILLTPSGGTPPYTYNWSTGATTNEITGLSAGTYSVTVTESEGCTLERTATINEPPALGISLTGSDVTCPSGSNGSATATVSGGVPPYTYSWNTGASTAGISGLTAGTYTVTVIDANLCEASQSISIDEPPLLQGSVATVDAQCPGAPNGSATANITGGTPPYTYAWSDGQSGPSITGLAAGTYTLSVTDDNGCMLMLGFDIDEPDGIAITLNINNIFCDTGGSGAMTASAIGGTPPYSFEWSNGASTATISGLAAGEYTVTVTDLNECEASFTGMVEEFPGLMLNPVATAPQCFGENNGAAAVAVTGGTPPFTYQWSNGSTDAELLNISAGVYQVTITDAAGCTGEATVDVAEPAELVAEVLPANVSNVACNAFANGEATVTVTGGTMPYTILWSNGQTGATATNLAAGTYTANITDANGCMDDISVTITEPPVLNITVNAGTSATCDNATEGTASVSAGGGTPPYTYAWSNGASTAAVSNLAAGAYSVTVTDANGCTADDSVVITAFDSPTCSIAITREITPPGNNGELQVNVSGGTAPFSYLWSNGQTAAAATGLSSGTYSVTVTDANGCETSCSATLSPPARLGDYVWLDSDQDGIQDPNEDGIPGVMVILQIPTDANPTNIDTTFTDGDGFYFFDVVPGEYKVTFVKPGGLEFTNSNQGSNDALDSDADPVMGMTGIYVIGPGEENLTIDAGLFGVCINITDPGVIGYDQYLCGPGNDPDEIVDVVTPSGGAGAIEYLWMKSTVDQTFNNQTWMPIPGATGPSYDPPAIFETTYYTRCVRRENCTLYVEGNVVTVEVGDAANAEVNAPAFLCVGEPTTITAGPTGPGAVLSWEVYGDATPTSGTGSSITVTATASGIVTVALYVSENGCDAFNFVNLTVTSSPLYCGNGNRSLPINVEVMDEEAGTVMVSWMMEELLASGHTFTVEYSENGTDFEVLGEMNTPKAFLGSRNYYEFEHLTTKRGRNFYRIQIHSQYGDVFFSEIGEAVLYNDSEVALLYPNPTNGHVALELFENFGEEVQVEAVSSNGSRLFSRIVSEDTKRVSFDLSGYPAGVYFFHLRYSRSGVKVLKVLKK